MFKIELGVKGVDTPWYGSYSAVFYEFTQYNHSNGFEFSYANNGEDTNTHELNEIWYLAIDNEVYIKDDYKSDKLKMIILFLEQNRR